MKKLHVLIIALLFSITTNIYAQAGWQRDANIERLMYFYSELSENISYNHFNITIFNDSSIVLNEVYQETACPFVVLFPINHVAPDTVAFLRYTKDGILSNSKFFGSNNNKHSNYFSAFQLNNNTDKYAVQKIYENCQCKPVALGVGGVISCANQKYILYQLDSSFTTIKKSVVAHAIFNNSSPKESINQSIHKILTSSKISKYNLEVKIWNDSLLLQNIFNYIDTFMNSAYDINLVELMDNNNILIVVTSNEDSTLNKDGTLLTNIKIKSYTTTGQLLWEKNIKPQLPDLNEENLFVKLTYYNNGILYMVYSKKYIDLANSTTTFGILKINDNGQILAQQEFTTDYTPHCLNVMKSKIQILTSKDYPYNYRNRPKANQILQFDARTFQPLNTIYNPIKKMGTYYLNDKISSYTTTTDSSMIGLVQFVDLADLYSYTVKNILLKINSNGETFTTKLNGNVYGDINTNCHLDSTDFQLKNNTVHISGNQDYYVTSDSTGFYEQYLDSGNYQIKLLKNANYTLWDSSACTADKNVHIRLNDSSANNFGLKPIVTCPSLEVNITTPLLQQCFETKYYVQYCNNGTENAANAYIDVFLDPYLSFQSSQRNFTALGNNVFRFPIGSINVNECGLFDFTVLVSCDSAVAGQTHCTEAHIYPDSICLPTPYNGAYIVASAQCLGDTVAFKLKNKGSNMIQARRYIVTQDVVIRMANPYQLNTGQEIIIKIPVDDESTFRIEAEQDINFPQILGDPYAVAFIQNCNLNNRFDTGFIPLFPLYDGEPYRDIDCQQNRNSFDPNDKVAQPLGVDTAHFIPKNTDITYTIRFQNTGNAPARFVTIIDTISDKLDISSLRLGAATHTYNFSQIDSNVIRFDFNTINLPDSATNQLNSHGFIQFTLKQKRDLPIHTIINNTAKIYFDYNDAVITNTTWHTIGENYLKLELISKIINTKYNTKEVKVNPNPFNEFSTIKIDGELIPNVLLQINDLTGKLIYQNTTSSNEFSINRSDFKAGIYFFTISQNSTIISTGKIIAQ